MGGPITNVSAGGNPNAPSDGGSPGTGGAPGTGGDSASAGGPGVNPGPIPGSYTRFESGAVTMEMAYIPPGDFLMLAPSTPDRKVTISNGFWMHRFETTSLLYKAVAGQAGGENIPVVNVHWVDVMAWHQKLTTLFEADIPPGYEFRLPTEAEWEYAARAGATGRTWPGDLEEFAWCSGPDVGREPGLKKANDWGLFDTLGHRWEWVYDYQSPAPSGTFTDPINHQPGATNGNWRGYRGGRPGAGCHFDRRDGNDPNSGGSGHTSFRTALAPKIIDEVLVAPAN